MREPSPDVEAPHVFGALHLLKRKTGEVASHIALDTNRVTLGRERECDIRLYFEDVSKLHAEILFDDDSGLANLVVHGNNGLIFTPAGGAGKQYYPPSVLALGDGDTLQIRKKLFRFSYGDTVASSYHSPAATPAQSRRLSHRLSIVPQGKRFAPSPAKSRFATPARPASQVEDVEEEDEPLVFDELVGLAEGDEGDKIYLEKRDEKPKNPFMTPQPKGRAPLRNTSAVPRTRTLTFALPDKSELERHNDGSNGLNYSDEYEHLSEEEEDMALLDEGIDEEHEDEDVPAPATPTPASIPLPDVAPMGGPRRSLVTPRAAYVTPRGPGSDSLRRALLIRSARRRIEAETIESEVVSGHVEVRRRRSTGRTLSPPQPDSDSSEASEDEDKENTPALQWVYEDGQGGLDDSDSDRESLDTEYSIPGARILDFHTSPDPGSPSESEGSDDDVSEEESGEYSSDERDVSHEDEYSEEHEGEEVGDISSDIDDEVDRSLVCPPEEVERSPSPVAARFYTPQPKRNVYGGARTSLAGIGSGPLRFATEHSPVSEHLPTGLRIPKTPSRLGKPVRLSTPARSTPAEPEREDPSEESDEAEMQAPAPPATPPAKTPAKGGLTPAQRAQLATPLHLPSAPAESFRNSVPRPVETPRRSTFLEALRSARKNSVSFAEAEPETPARMNGFGSMRKRMTPRVDRIEEVDSLPPTPTATAEIAQALIPPPQPSPQPAHASPQPQPEGERRHSRRRSLTSPMAGIRDLLKPKSKPAPATPTLGINDLVREPKVAKTPSFAGMREMFRAPQQPATPALGGVREMFAERVVPPTPHMELAGLFAERVVPPTPHMELASVFPEPEEHDEHDAEAEAEASESGEDAEEREAKPRTRSRVPTRRIPARTTRAASRTEEPEEKEPKPAVKTRRRAKDESETPEPVPEPAPARNTRRKAAAAAAPSPERSRSAPTRRVTRSQTAEPEEVETKPVLERETKSAPTRRAHEPEKAPTRSVPEPAKSGPTRRSRRVLGEAEPAKEEPKATKTAKTTRSATLSGRKAQPEGKNEKAGKGKGSGVADKENSATPDPEPKRKTALPVRVTRSRKA